jgi:hypothetical protein
MLNMATTQPRSAGVTAAATLLIMYSVSGLLLWAYFFIPLLDTPLDDSGKHMYELYPIAFFLLASIPPALIAVGVRIAIGLFHLKSWARIGGLIGAAIATALCLLVIARWPFETFVIPYHFVGPIQSMKQRLMISFVIMLLPVNVWWLFLFRMKSVKAQFSPVAIESSSVTASTTEKV